MTTTEPDATAAAAPDDAGVLLRLVAQNAELLDEVRDLRRRLDRLEAERPDSNRPAAVVSDEPNGDATPGPAEPLGGSALDAPTSRRTLLTRGAAAAATAVAGTAAIGLATAQPAAAATGTFNGSPAVTATASPGSGTAINASSVSGTAIAASSSGTDAGPVISAYSATQQDASIYAEATATVGTTRGVYGVANSWAGIALMGVNAAESGDALGVFGQNSADGGVAVRGQANATTGPTVGVSGQTQSTGASVGVEGVASAATGDTVGVRGVASSATGKGVAGVADSSQNNTNYGVWGHTTSRAGYGVAGFADADAGVATGVLGHTTSPGGTGVRAVASGPFPNVALVASSDRIQVLLAGSPGPPPDTSPAGKGSLVFDNNSDLWICVASGSPGTWRKLAGLATAGAFHVLPSTVRIYDSRAGLNPTGVPKGQLGNFATRTIDAKTNGAVPAGASAVLVNLTIVNTGSPGYLGLFKNGITWPGNTTINWNQPSTLLANSAICALDDQALFAVKSNVGFCDFVIDAIGYYR